MSNDLSNDLSNEVDVVVVGGGVSGLHLAGLIHQVGLSFLLLEASDRLGGRLLTVDPGVDLGATWFWQHEKDVLDLIARFGLKTFPQYATGNMIYQSNEGVMQLDGNPLDHKAMRITGGMQKLVSKLAQLLPDEVIKLSTKVTQIEFKEQVHISTDITTYRSKCVVLALAPATALANINFTPHLPQQLQSIAINTPVWMGGYRKVIAIYDSPFWRADGLAGSAMSHIGPLREIHDISDEEAKFGALFGFAQGGLTQGEVITQLVQLFGPKAKSPTKVIIQDWSALDLISPPNVAQLNDYQLFGSPELRSAYFDNRLYFTSTETATDSAGHIQGALSAAQRSANLILSRI